MKERILIVSHDAETNALGRAAVLADLLEPAFSVTIAAFGGRAWAPLEGDSRLNLLPMPTSNLGVPLAAQRLAQSAAGAAALIAVKPRALSYGLASIVRHRRPLFLDIDDYEPAFVRRRFGWARQLLTPDHAPITRLLERWRPANATVTVASRSLQRRYGGIWIPHVRDRGTLSDQVQGARSQMRRTLGIPPDVMVVGFVGTVRSHKGLPALADAIGHLPGCLLLLAGNLSDSGEEADLNRRAAGRLIVMPGPTIDRLGHALAAVDVAAIPQSTDIAARFQSPAKLLDAMAAGLPIVAGETGDAAELLGDTGMLVPPGQVTALVAALERLRDPGLRTRLGAAAFNRYQDQFSLPIWRTMLQDTVVAAIDRTRRPT